MKKSIIALLLCASFGYAQEKLSEPSLFIKKSDQIQINMDENEKATFKSGLGETVEFYPSEIIDLKTKERMIGLAVESTYIVGQQGMATILTKETAWIGMDEIADMIEWFEKYAVPNIELEAGKKKTVKFIYSSKELEIKFEIYGNTQVFSVILNNSYNKEKYFWTQAKVKDMPNVLKTIKYLQTKK